MIDFDGVLADLSGAFIRGCNEKFGTTYVEGDEVDWSWWRRQPKQFADYVWKELYPDPEWTLHEVLPYEGAIDALRGLVFAHRGHCVVTARKKGQERLVEDWLGRFGIAMPVIATGGAYPKAHYCKLHRLDVAIDDGAHNLEPMIGTRTNLFLVDRPWNRQKELPTVTRVPGLAGAMQEMGHA